MSIQIQDIAPFSAPANTFALRKADRSAWPENGEGSSAPTRRTFLKGLSVMALALGLWALDLWRFPRRASADGYDMASTAQGCVGLEYRNCDGCGPSTLCDHCCYNAYPGTAWHKDSSFANYGLRPNQCSGYDGWYWSANQGECGCGSQYKKFKCHDGKFNTGSGWMNTICPQPRGCRPAGAWPY